MPFFARIKNKSINDLIDREKFIKSYIERGDEICAYERRALPEKAADNFFLIEVKILQARRSYMVMKSTQQIANSRMFIFDKRWTVRDVKLELFKFFRPLLPSFKGPKIQPKKGVSPQAEESAQIEEEFKYYFEGKSS